MTELSCGLSVGCVSPDSASMKRPSMNSWCRIGVRRPAACWMSETFMAVLRRKPAVGDRWEEVRGGRRVVAGRSELDGDLRALALLDLVHEAGRPVLPHEEHRALRAESLVAAIGRHRGHVARLHDDARHGLAGVLVAAVPM